MVGCLLGLLLLGPVPAVFDDDFLEVGGSNQPEEQLLNEEQRALIQRAIAALPDLYRHVLVLSDVEGLPNADIAETLGLTVPAVKTRLRRARLLLRDKLAPHFETVS